jgi:hypothetical protein
MNTFKTLLAAACVLAPTTALAACTGPFANAVVQSHAKTILADVKSKDQKSRLGAVGVLKMFAETLRGEIFRVADALPSPLGPNSWAIYRQLVEQLQSPDHKPWSECFPDLAPLMAESERAQRAAAAEAAKPASQLRVAYQRYIYVKFCSEVRQGYSVVFVSDAELERARAAIKSIEASALAADSTINTDQVWEAATNQMRGVTANRDQCQFQYVSLVNTAGGAHTPKKDF